MGGWDMMRSRLRGEEDGRPMLYVFSTFRAFIRTVPVLQHDQSRVEDLDTEAEDPAADETRYACMSRPWVAVTMVKLMHSSGWEKEIAGGRIAQAVGGGG
jgi:hypothetical protein